MTLYPNLILDALKNVKYPGNGKSLAENDMIEDDIRIDGNKVSFSLIFDRPTDPFIRSVVRAAEAAVNTYISPEVEIKGNIAVKYRKPIEEKPELLPGVKNIVGISSGKGGVGKSTVAANVAISLASMGYKVGLLDADIFGPSMPKMFGVEDEQLYMVKKDGRDWIEPVEKYGVKMLSIGFVVDKNSPVLWRGGMASNALKQLIGDAWWGDLDYFLIDMPPGTSDIHLTLVQTLPITGVVVVSTRRRWHWPMPVRESRCSAATRSTCLSLVWWRIWHGSLRPPSRGEVLYLRQRRRRASCGGIQCALAGADSARSGYMLRCRHGFAICSGSLGRGRQQ